MTVQSPTCSCFEILRVEAVQVFARCLFSSWGLVLRYGYIYREREREGGRVRAFPSEAAQSEGVPIHKEVSTRGLGLVPWIVIHVPAIIWARIYVGMKYRKHGIRQAEAKPPPPPPTTDSGRQNYPLIITTPMASLTGCMAYVAPASQICVDMNFRYIPT